MKNKFLFKLIMMLLIVTIVFSFSKVTLAALTEEQRAIKEKFQEANLFEMTISELCLGIGDYFMEYMTFLMGEEITVERLIFNKVVALNANFFNNSVNPSAAPTTKFVRELVNDWYKMLGVIAIMIFLIALIVIGIMIMLGSPLQKATYQEILGKWIIGIAIYFFFPYVMKYAFNLNEAIIGMVAQSFNGGNELIYTYIGGVSDLREEEIEFRSPEYTTQSSQLLKLGSEEATVVYMNKLSTYKSRGDIMRIMRAMAGITGRLIFVIIWFVMLFQLTIFLYIYFKRYLMIAFLIAIFPITLFEYIIGTIVSGKQSAIGSWSKEFFVNVFLQSIHAAVYGITSGVIMNQILYEMQGGKSASANWLLMIIATTFVFTGEKTLREIINAISTETVKSGEDVAGSVKGGFNKVKGAVGKIAGGMKK